MKKKTTAIAALFLAGLFLAGPGLAAEVCQGKCISFAPDSGSIRIEEFDTNFSQEAPYGNATGIIAEIDCRNAKIGIVPEPGDVVRIAYDIQGDRKVALKVMNVSKQDLRRK